MQTITFEGCDHIIMSPEDYEALKKDAARYRWLRDRIPASVLEKRGKAAGCWIDCEADDGKLILLTGKDADDEIDAAMKD